MKRKQSIMKKNKNVKKTKKNTKNTKNNTKIMSGGGKLNFCTYDAVSTSKNGLGSSGSLGSGSLGSGSLDYSGIINVDNTCFMNATIQMLWSIPEIRKDILGLDTLKMASQRSSDQITAARCLHDIFNFFKNNKNSNKYYNNKNICETLRGIFNQYEDINTQEDAGEFLINVIFKCFSNNKKNKFLNIEKYFKFQIEYIVKCVDPSSNRNIKNRVEQSSTLLLTLDKNSNTIKTLIDNICKTETTSEENYVDMCNDPSGKNTEGKGPANLSVKYMSFSSNLIINLGRYTVNKKTQAVSKLNYSITPDNPLQIGSDSFQLKGCICHDGGLGGGHYVYLVFDDKGKPIKYISDDNVSNIDPKNTDHLTRGYLYYYRKIQKYKK